VPRRRVSSESRTLLRTFWEKRFATDPTILNGSEAITGELDADAEDLKRELIHFGQKFMAVLYSPDAIAVRRLAIAESRHSDVGKLSFEQGTAPIEKQVAEFLKKVMKHGALRTADPKVAAIHLLSLLESELLQRVLLGVIDTVKPEVLSGAVRRAVDVFLSGYGRR
jgi:AefR-like transcriptional repressor, C-terminal domain